MKREDLWQCLRLHLLLLLADSCYRCAGRLLNGKFGTASQSTDQEPHSSTFSRGKGTLFLVDTKSRQVVWSGYNRPARTGSSRGSWSRISETRIA